MARVQRIIDTVDTLSLIIGSLPAATLQRAEFAAEEVYDDSDPPVYLHYLVTMDESVAAEFDAALADLAELIKVGLRRYAADLCRAREDGGLDYSGTPLPTDSATRQDLVEAHIAIAADTLWSIPMELPGGTVLVLDATTLPPALAAVAGHRRAARLIYEAVKADIAVGTITTAAEIDVAFAA